MDYAKSTGIQVKNWTAIAGGTSGNSGDIATIDDLATVLHIDLASTSTNAIAAGSEAEVVVHVKHGTGNPAINDIWSEYSRYRMTGGTPLDTSTDNTVDSTETTLQLALTTTFETLGQVFFLKDATLANSEIVQTADFSAGIMIEATEPFVRDHANSTTYVYNNIKQWNVLIPKTVSLARVTIHNPDADATYAYRVRYTQVTDIA
jgi:hypothetical protein